MGRSNFANMFNLTCGVVTADSTGNRESDWKARAAHGGYFVELSPPATDAVRNPDYPIVRLPNAATGYIFGRLIAVSGTGSKFRVTVAIVGSATVSTGITAAALGRTVYYNTLQVATTGLVTTTTATAGNVKAIGGTADQMQVMWNGFTADMG